MRVWNRHSLSDSVARKKAYESLSYKAGDFPVTERVAQEIVSLPMFPQLTAKQQATVAGEALHFVDQHSSRLEVAGTRELHR